MRAILLIIAGAGTISVLIAPMFLLLLLGAICMTIVGWEVGDLRLAVEEEC